MDSMFALHKSLRWRCLSLVSLYWIREQSNTYISPNIAIKFDLGVKMSFFDCLKDKSLIPKQRKAKEQLL